MIQLNEFTFPSSNEQNLIYCREYIPEGEPRAIVQLAHGIAEHILRYDEFARTLASRGYIVVGNDHLGHGRSIASPEELGWFGESRGWEHVLEDMHTLHRLTRTRHPGLAYFMLGHSMGSFLVRCYVIRYREPLDGILLTGTGHRSRAVTGSAELLEKLECRRRGGRYQSQLLQRTLTGQRSSGQDVPRFAAEWISRDEQIIEAYFADPLCGFVPSVALFRDMLGGMDYMVRPKNLERMRKDMPVIFLSGDCDPVGERGKGVIRAYKAFLSAGMRDVTMKLYTGARHEILNEINRREVYEDILSWLDAKCGK